MTYSVLDRLEHTGDRMKVINSVDVVIKRDGSISHPIKASWGKTEGTEYEENVAVLDIRYQDFIFDRDDYQIGSGIPVDPLKGDAIIVCSTGDEFMVVPVAGQETPFQYTTSSRSRVRVHSMQTKD